MNLAAELRADSAITRGGGNTYTTVLSKDNIAKALQDNVPQKIMNQHSFPSLQHLMHYISRQTNESVPQSLRRNLEFHSLQISFDLVALNLVHIDDGCTSCPVVGGTKGSAGGLQHVRRMTGDKSIGLEDAARMAELTCIMTQTALCEYDKYIRWSCGLSPMRVYTPSRLRATK